MTRFINEDGVSLKAGYHKGALVIVFDNFFQKLMRVGKKSGSLQMYFINP